MTTTDVSAALAAASQVTAAIDNLRNQRAQLATKAVGIEEELAALWRAPLLADELMELMLGSVDAAARRFASKAQARVRQCFEQFAAPEAISRPPVVGPVTFDPVRRHKLNRGTLLNMQDLDQGTYALPLDFLALVDSEGGIDQDALCYLWADRIKEILGAHRGLLPSLERPARPASKVASLKIDERRLCIAAAKDELAATESQLGALDEQIATLEKALSQAGATRGQG